MTDPDADLRRQLAEVHERLARHERLVVRVMTGVVVVGAVVLLLLLGPLLAG